MSSPGAPPIALGGSPAGIDPVAPYATPPTLSPVPAVQYLGQTHDYNAIPADPIDVDVALSLAVPQGSCRHAPLAGNLLHTINPLGRPDQHQTIVDMVNTSNPIARRLQAGDIAIVSVEDAVDQNGQLRVRVGYRNLRRKTGVLFASNR